MGKPSLFIVKIGGNIIDNAAALKMFLQQFAAIPAPKILVHGGGKLATRMGDQLGMVSQYIDGRRITDEATIDLVTMVYGGLVNKKIVAALQSLHCNALGVTGADANLLPAVKRPVRQIDYGFVGDIPPHAIQEDTWKLFLQHQMVPVVAPLTHDMQGQILNTNADTIASAIAVALSTAYKVRLIYCFEKKGVLEDVNNDQSVITLMNKSQYLALKTSGKLFEGILPKLDNAFAAIDAGVKEVLIGHAEDLAQNISHQTTGTLIVT